MSDWYETGSIPRKSGRGWQWLSPEAPVIYEGQMAQMERIREDLRKREDRAQEAMAIESIKQTIKKRDSSDQQDLEVP